MSAAAQAQYQSALKRWESQKRAQDRIRSLGRAAQRALPGLVKTLTSGPGRLLGSRWKPSKKTWAKVQHLGDESWAQLYRKYGDWQVSRVYGGRLERYRRRTSHGLYDMGETETVQWKHYLAMKAIADQVNDLSRRVREMNNLPPMSPRPVPPRAVPAPRPAPRPTTPSTSDALRKELEARYQTGNALAQRLIQNLQRLAATNPMTASAARAITLAAQRASQALTQQAQGTLLIHKKYRDALRVAIQQALRERERTQSERPPEVVVPSESEPEAPAPAPAGPLETLGAGLSGDIAAIQKAFTVEFAKAFESMINPSEDQIYTQLRRVAKAQRRIAQEGL